MRHIHPDVIIIDKPGDKREIVVDQIRELRQDAYVMPNEAMQKAYLVNNADSMNINAQNAFLQLLEDPPAHAVFILSAENPAALLPTVRSRCSMLKAQTVADTKESPDADELVTLFLEALDNDNTKLVRCMFRLEKLDKLAFEDFINSARAQIALSLRAGSSRGALIYAENVLKKAGEMLAFDVNPVHISGMICASLIGR